MEVEVITPIIQCFIACLLAPSPPPYQTTPTRGKCEAGGYEFFYNGWKHLNSNSSNYKVVAKKEDMFPEDRGVKLDHDYLQKMGLTKQSMEECDAFLFFHQFG